jgi:hypothetical protein
VLRGVAKHMKRFPSINLRLILSVTLFLGTIGFWSYNRRQRGFDQVSWRLSEARYSLRFEANEFVLAGPPKPESVLGNNRVVEASRRLSNNDLEWMVRAIVTEQDYEFQKYPSISVPDLEWSFPKRPSAIIALLDALEDPNRFAIAHYLLSSQLEDYSEIVSVNANVLQVRFNTLDVELHPMLGDLIGPRPRNPNCLALCRGSPSVRLDPAQLPRIRRYWHDKFDVKLMRVPYWGLLLAFLVYPILSGYSRLRAARRTKLGLCLRCGYDVRANPIKCPECGWCQSSAHLSEIDRVAV